MEESTVSKCVRCSTTRQGKEYGFYFGNQSKLDIEEYQTGTGRGFTQRSAYVIAGEGHAFVCDSCVRRHRSRFYWVFGPLVLAGCAAIFVAVGSVVGAVVVGSGGVVWIVFYLNDITGVSFSEAGSQLAIAAKRREFEIRGYRVLFRPGERRGSKSAS